MPRISKRARLLKEYEAISKSHTVKAYIHLCLDEEDSFEDEIDDCTEAELEVLSHRNSSICL